MYKRQVTSSLVFEGGGVVREYVGGYDDWLRQRPAPEPVPEAGRCPAGATAARKKPSEPKRAGLSYKDRRDLETLPERIEALEAEQLQLQQEMASPDFYRRDGEAIAEANQRLAGLEEALARAYARWEALESARA